MRGVHILTGVAQCCERTHPPSPSQIPIPVQVLEDIALTLQVQIPESSVPFCACNSGNDVFVDIGNKSLGLEALMLYTGAQPDEVRQSAWGAVGGKPSWFEMHWLCRVAHLVRASRASGTKSSVL
eukprot:364558-Chlamydomonas_euryale.AAC.17